MEQIPWPHLFSQLGSLIYTSIVTSVVLSALALCLQLPRLLHARFLRALTGTALSASLMLISPLIYSRPRQHMGAGLATMTYMAALTMFDWCLLQPSDATPSVVDVLASFVWQPMSGIIAADKANKNAKLGAKQLKPPYEHQKDSKQLNQHQQAPVKCHGSRFQQLRDNLPALLRVMVIIDVVSAVLECWLCYGDLSAWQNLVSSSATQQQHATAVASAITSVFATITSQLPSSTLVYSFRLLTTLVAGVLLGAQLEFSYMAGRIVLILCGYPHIGPIHMFNKPWMAVSLSDLWSRRWHQVLRFYFTGLGYSLADDVTAKVTAALSLALRVCYSVGSKVVGLRAGAKPGLVESSDASGSSSRGSSSARHRNEASRNSKPDSSLSAPAVTVDGSSAPASGNHGQQQQQQPQEQQQQWPAVSPELHSQLKRTMRTLIVFAISGLVHEYVTWAAFGVWTWTQLVFFMLHGVAIIAENLGSKVLCHFGQSNKGIPVWLGRACVLGFMAWTAPAFIDVYLQSRHFHNYVPPFVVPVTAEVMQRYGLCSCGVQSH